MHHTAARSVLCTVLFAMGLACHGGAVDGVATPAAPPAPVVPPVPPAPMAPAVTAIRSISVPGTTYFVDAVRGNDENSGRTRGLALKTLTEAARRLDPRGGDKLVLRGVFRETLRLVRLNKPTSGQPNPSRPTVVQCDFNAAGVALEARIDGGISGAASFPFDKRGLPEGFGPGTGNYLTRGVVVTDSNYVTVSGVDVRGIAGQGVLSWKSSHVRFEHLRVEWTAESAMLMTNGGPDEPDVRDLTVAYCRINQSNLGAWRNESTRQGYNMSSETLSVVQFDGFRILENHLSNSGKEGIAFKVGSTNGAVHNNFVENMRSAGIYETECWNTAVFRNIVRRIGYYDPEDGSGLQEASPYLSSKLPFTLSATGATGIRLGNGDFGPQEEFETGRTGGLRIMENEISWTLKGAISVHNTWRIAGRPGGSLDDIWVYNNVAYKNCQGSTSGPAAISIDVTLTNGLIFNNIVARSRKRGIFVVDAATQALSPTSVIAVNLLYQNAQAGENGLLPLFGNPRFIAPPRSPSAPANFALQRTSPAIDSGFPMPVDIGSRQVELASWEAGRGPVR